MHKVVLFLWLACCGLTQVTRAQGDEFLAHFSVIETDGQVLLNWTTRMGNTCNGIDILRATDGLHYDRVGHIAGICGSPGEAQAFTYTDLAPAINQTNYYKLLLGSLGESSVRTVEVVQVGATGYLLKPHPVVDESKLYFENATHAECRLSAYSPDGNVVLTQSTREGYFVIERAGQLPGLYFFTVQDEAGRRLAQGKLLLR